MFNITPNGKRRLITAEPKLLFAVPTLISLDYKVPPSIRCEGHLSDSTRETVHKKSQIRGEFDF